MEISIWFITVFMVMWALGPGTQVVQLVAPEFHKRMGFTEKRAFEPEFLWYRLYERGTAYADLTYFFAGIAFIWLALAGSETALIFGFYTCSVFVFVMTQYLCQLVLLTRESLHPISKEQTVFYFVFGVLFIAFGLFGLYYLWGVASN